MLPDSILPTPEDDIARVLRDYERRLSHLETLEGAAGGALVLIEDINLLADAAVFDFQNIPATHKHLKIIAQMRSVKAGANNEEIYINFNADGAANYFSLSWAIYIAAVPSAVERIANAQPVIGNVAAATSPGDFFDGWDMTIHNYAGTTANKTLTAEGMLMQNTVTGNISFRKGIVWWDDTAAINQIEIRTTGGNNFAGGSRATLYGLS